MLPFILAGLVYFLGVAAWAYIDAKTSLSDEEKYLLNLLKEAKEVEAAQVGEFVKISGTVKEGKTSENIAYRADNEETELIAPLQSKKVVYLLLEAKEEIDDDSKRDLFAVRDMKPFSIKADTGQTIQAKPKQDLKIYSLNEEKIGPVVGLSEELDKFIKKHNQSLVGEKGFIRRKYFYETAILEEESYFFIGKKLSSNSIEPVVVSPYEGTISTLGTVDFIEVVFYAIVSLVCGGFLVYGALYALFEWALGL